MGKLPSSVLSMYIKRFGENVLFFILHTLLYNMKRKGIGEFEELVLLSICVLNNEAYSIAIRSEVEKRTGRAFNISAIQTTLYRMEDKGLVSSELGEANQVRGGKRKRMFSVTAYGLKSLAEIKSMRNGFWEDIPPVVLRTLGS